MAYPLDTTASTFGQRLREARKRAGMSLEDVAKRVGVTRAAISSLELGKSSECKADNLFAIADALQCSPRWLTTGENSLGDGEVPHSMMSTTPTSSFAERIRAAREEAGLSISGLARKAQHNRASLQQYESGVHMCGSSSIYRLSEALGVSARWLATGSGSSHRLETLTSTELELLIVFRALEAPFQDHAVKVLRGLIAATRDSRNAKVT